MARTTHQRVYKTRWSSWWSTRGGEDKNHTPTSHIDSLVVLVVDGEWGWRERHTNESIRLVGRRGGRQGAGKIRTTHQRVILTRWWSWWLTGSGDGENDTPTSL